MQRKKHLREDLRLMHRMYEDLMSAYNSAEAANERLRRQVDDAWRRSRRDSSYIRTLEERLQNGNV